MLYAAGRLQLREIEVRKLAVVRKFVDAKINRFVVRLISQTVCDELFNHRDHPVDVTLVGGGGEFICAFDPQRFGIFKERLFELFGELRQRHFGLARAANRLVVDIGDVHHPMHLVTAQLQMALKQIFEDVSAKIPDVCAAVDGRPTGVDADCARRRIARLEFFDLARVSVKKAQRH